jgi:uncharacterized protein (DUF2141 family)
MTQKTKRLCFIAGALALCAVASSMQAKAGSAARVEVDVVGVRGDDGTIGCQLFASEAGFPRDTGAAIAKMRRPIAGGSAACVFSGLSAGTYAVAVMHDANGIRRRRHA